MKRNTNESSNAMDKVILLAAVVAAPHLDAGLALGSATVLFALAAFIGLWAAVRIEMEKP